LLFWVIVYRDFYAVIMVNVVGAQHPSPTKKESVVSR
jgi:hypothetical protein